MNAHAKTGEESSSKVTEWVILAPMLVVALLMVAASLWMLSLPALQILGASICLLLLPLMVLGRSLRTVLVGTAVIAVVLSVALANWPARAAFSLSRPAFDRIAREIDQGKTPDEPLRVGLFTIRKAEVDRGVVCLWTDLNWSGRSGFIQCSQRNPPFNLWSRTPLDASWQYIEED